MDDTHAGRRPTGSLIVALAVFLFLGSCSGEPTMSEYADDVEQLVVTMNFGLDALDPLLEDPRPTLDDVRAYASGRVALREEFISGLALVEPPDRVRDLHEAVTEIMTRLTAAESVMADEVLALDEGADLSNLWDTGAGRAAQAIDAEAIAFCKAAEADFEATEGQAVFGDIPWIPPDMKEVVRVAFYCERSDRQG